jgi:hypothetical protein
MADKDDKKPDTPKGRKKKSINLKNVLTVTIGVLAIIGGFLGGVQVGKRRSA